MGHLRPRSKTQDTRQIMCFCCSHPGHKAKDPSCPALGKTCSHCGKQGHFAGVCKGTLKQAHDTRNDAKQRNGLPYVTAKHDTSDDEYLFAVGDTKEDKTVSITVAGTLTPVIIDSGASVNVLDSATFNLLTDESIQLRNSTVKVYPRSRFRNTASGQRNIQCSSVNTATSNVCRLCGC